MRYSKEKERLKTARMGIFKEIKAFLDIRVKEEQIADRGTWFR